MKNAFYFFQSTESRRGPQWRLVGSFGSHIPTSTLVDLIKARSASHLSDTEPQFVDFEEIDDDTDWQEVMDCDSM